ncbi:MAG: hypothetical protein AAF646_05560 [Pseudomonadota bacterium]
MTYMTDAPQADHPVARSGGAGMGGNDATGALMGGQYRLRRLGARPLAFAGIELGMAMSYTSALPYWFEINLYRASDGTFPVSIKQFYQSSEEKDLARAWVAPTLDEALEIVENFDPAHDVPVSLSLLGSDMSAAEMEAAAFDLQAQVEHARTHYKTLVGEFFHGMDGA